MLGTLLAFVVSLTELTTLISFNPVYVDFNISRKDTYTVQQLSQKGLGPKEISGIGATIVFTVIVLNENLPGGNTIAITAVCTIMLSIIAHGLSANPLIAGLAARLKGSDTKSAGNNPQ